MAGATALGRVVTDRDPAFAPVEVAAAPQMDVAPRGVRRYRGRDALTVKIGSALPSYWALGELLRVCVIYAAISSVYSAHRPGESLLALCAQ